MNITLLNSGPGLQHSIGSAGRFGGIRETSEDYMVRTIGSACGMFPSSFGHTRVFAYNVKTNELRQQSNCIEPCAKLQYEAVLISDRRMRQSRPFAVFLDPKSAAL